MQKKFNFRRPRRIRKGVCSFCSSKTTPDYKEVSPLREYMSERGRIIGKDRTGVCPRHQRMLGVAIKRARHLALLPFMSHL